MAPWQHIEPPMVRSLRGTALGYYQDAKLLKHFSQRIHLILQRSEASRAGESPQFCDPY